MNDQQQKQNLTQGSVAGHILRMTPPMAVGFLSMMAFNLADTWFVSRLGTDALAAMGFTFPVVMILHSIAMGLGLGTSAGISRAIGEGDRHRVQRLTTDSLGLAFLIFLLLAGLGLATIDRIFPLLGTSPDLLPLVRAYMTVWFLAAPVSVLPMIGNNALRATGDTLYPSIVMSSAAILNCILDPILIFGLFGFPELGIVGAALATAFSRFLTVAASFYLLKRNDMLAFSWEGVRETLRSWTTVLHVGIPAAGTNLLQPITNAMITRILAGFGKEAVAATSAAQRVEMFAYLVPMAMGTVLVPLIGQNWGAGNHDRVRTAYTRTNLFGVCYAVVCLVVIMPIAPWIGKGFSADPGVVRLIAMYLRVIMVGSVMLHILVHTGFAFNAAGSPLRASALNVLRTLGLVLPLAWVGAHLFGVPGIYGGLALAHLLGGSIALAWFSRFLRGATATA